MKVNLAHVNIQGINCAIFDAKPRSGTHRAALEELLSGLVIEARSSNLRVDKAALAYSELGGIKFFGSDDLVRFLSNNGLPRWTHTLDVN
jgi:hypothetical protein